MTVLRGGYEEGGDAWMIEPCQLLKQVTCAAQALLGLAHEGACDSC